jgi:hypothetical protein
VSAFNVGFGSTALLSVVACILLAGCTGPPGAAATPTPQVTVTSEGQGNEATVSAEGETIVINVHSESGIGTATIEPDPETPLANILVRLHLQGLEGFHFSYDQTVITAQAPSGRGDIPQSVRSSGGDETLITSDSPYWIDIRIVSEQATPQIPLDNGYFEVRLPEEFQRAGRRSFSIQWIDFYR